MRTALENLLYFDPQNTSNLVLIVSACIAVALWLICLIDVKSSHRGFVGKTFWMLVLCVPVAGLLLYALSEFVFADWRAALSWRKNDAVQRPGAPIGPA